MGWEAVKTPSDSVWSDHIKNFSKKHGFSYYRKPRFFVDESLGEEAFRILKEMGLNVKGAWSEGLCGKDDGQVVQFARREHRIILTHDHDFLDDKLYPLKLCYGVVVFPYADKSDSGFENIFWGFMRMIGSEAGLSYQAKARVTEESTSR
jgi:predicted nuclease of predicted toxin-antitoxin system